MKKKMAAKLSNLVTDAVKSAISIQSDQKKGEYLGDFCENDPEISKKFRKLVIDLIEFKNVHINISNSYMTIMVDDLSTISSPSNTNKSSGINNLEININKSGFRMSHSYGNNRSNYLDSSIFDDLFPIVSNKLKEINAENFINIWEKVVKESKIIRNNNLEDLGI